MRRDSDEGSRMPPVQDEDEEERHDERGQDAVEAHVLRRENGAQEGQLCQAARVLPWLAAHQGAADRHAGRRADLQTEDGPLRGDMAHAAEGRRLRWRGRPREGAREDMARRAPPALRVPRILAGEALHHDEAWTQAGAKLHGLARALLAVTALRYAGPPSASRRSAPSARLISSQNATAPKQEAEPGYGVNVANYDGKLIDLKEAGIVDPARVAHEAIQNAVSIASTAMTMGALVVDIPEKQPSNPDAGMSYQ